MKKIKRFFIILILSITLFTTSYSRVDAIAIPAGITFKAILTYGLVAIAGLVAIDYTAEKTADNMQDLYDDYTDVMERELEDYVSENDWDEIFNDFKNDNNNNKNQLYPFGVEWDEDIIKLFKDFGNHIRSQFQEFPTVHTFFKQYGTLADKLDNNASLGMTSVYNMFSNRSYGALFVFQDTDLDVDDNSSFIFTYVAYNDITIEYWGDELVVSPTGSRQKVVYTGVYPMSMTPYSAYTRVFKTDNWKLIDVYEHENVNINSEIIMPDTRSIDDLKKAGLLVGGNKDILIEDAEWVDDVKKKGKSIDDVDIMRLDGDMDVDGNYIPTNVIPAISDDVWVDALVKKVPWDDLIKYPDVIIYDDDDAIVNTPDYPDDNVPDIYVPKNIDFGDNPELVRTDLKMVFPFCIPFDLIDAIKLFNAPPKAPVFEIPIPMGDVAHETITIDMEQFESLAQIFRIFMTIMFIMSLILITRQIIKG